MMNQGRVNHLIQWRVFKGTKFRSMFVIVIKLRNMMRNAQIKNRMPYQYLT